MEWVPSERDNDVTDVDESIETGLVDWVVRRYGVLYTNSVFVETLIYGRGFTRPLLLLEMDHWVTLPRPRPPYTRLRTGDLHLSFRQYKNARPFLTPETTVVSHYLPHPLTYPALIITLSPTCNVR